tara:strand:+ start:61 stop:753 length:693 start_codon:yes stop_codon:yes gene_type:complete
MNKKGFEMAANTIVVLIIAIVIFLGGIGITYKFFDLAEQRKATVDAETERSIENLLDTGAKVAVPIFKKKVKRGDLAVFAIGIRNVNAGPNFYVFMTFDEAIDKAGDKISTTDQELDDMREFINANWINTVVAEENILNQERSSIPMAIDVKGALCDSALSTCPDSTTVKGTYIFNVCVCDLDDPDNPQCQNYKDNDNICDVDGANGISAVDLYGKSSGGDIHKILVEVV